MKRKPKLLSQSDVREVLRFKEFLADVDDDSLSPEEFAKKYSDYMGCDEATGRAYIKGHREGK